MVLAFHINIIVLGIYAKKVPLRSLSINFSATATQIRAFGASALLSLPRSAMLIKKTFLTANDFQKTSFSLIDMKR